MIPANEYGLLIEQTNHYGTNYIEVRVVRREPGREDPLGCASDGESFYGEGTPKHLMGLALDGLGMNGFVSESSDSAFIGYDIEYRNVYATDEAKLKKMLKAIKRVNDRVEKDEAREPGDKFMALASALKLSFVVERVGKREYNVSPNWRWMSIAEGRNRYRGLIDELVAAAIARKVA